MKKEKEYISKTPDCYYFYETRRSKILSSIGGYLLLPSSILFTVGLGLLNVWALILGTALLTLCIVFLAGNQPSHIKNIPLDVCARHRAIEEVKMKKRIRKIFSFLKFKN
ncbi:MAG TPA: hypothetical protein VG621_01825 [Candidatus Paceibacterota bacterium]|nr:hypothetical protein [Candidatus Paceibacterota bacterium]